MFDYLFTAVLLTSLGVVSTAKQEKKYSELYHGFCELAQIVRTQKTQIVTMESYAADTNAQLAKMTMRCKKTENIAIGASVVAVVAVSMLIYKYWSSNRGNDQKQDEQN